MACLLVAIDAVIAVWALYSTSPVPSGVVRWLVPLAALPWSVDADRALFIVVGIAAIAAGAAAIAKLRIAPILLGVVGGSVLVLLAVGAVKTANATDGHVLGMEFDARAAFGSLILTLLGLLVVAGAVGVSRQTTTIAGLAALGLSLIIGILGPATSDYAGLHRAVSFSGTGSQTESSCQDASCVNGNSSSPGSADDGGTSTNGGESSSPDTTSSPSTATQQTAPPASTPSFNAQTAELQSNWVVDPGKCGPDPTDHSHPFSSTQTYEVTATIHLWSGPSVSSTPLAVITVDDHGPGGIGCPSGSGPMVTVTCKAAGQPISGPFGTDAFWDATTWNGQSGYLPDEWVNTKWDEDSLPPC